MKTQEVGGNMKGNMRTLVRMLHTTQSSTCSGMLPAKLLVPVGCVSDSACVEKVIRQKSDSLWQKINEK